MPTKTIEVGVGYLHAKLDNDDPPGVLYLTHDAAGIARASYNFFAPLGRRVRLFAEVIDESEERNGT